MVKLRWKRWLYLVHRWTGIALCLLFAAWFLSGVVMMYVDFPQLDRDERLSGLPPLDFSRAELSPAQAVARLSQGDFVAIGAPHENRPRAVDDPAQPLTAPAAVRLGMLLGRPVYRIDAGGGAQPCVVFADSGELLREVTPALAALAVEDFSRRWLARQAGDPPARHVEVRQTDQWTLSAAMNAHRPLHRIALDDDRGSEFYVSSTTGEVVRDSVRLERALNYVGAVTHWIYPTVIRRHPQLWVWLVDILSSAGVVLALTGLWIGVLRWKRNPRPGKSRIPYRGLMRWHYITGAIFGLFTLTWVFSGLLSMNPGGFNPPRAPSAAERAVTSGVTQPLHIGDFNAAVPAFDAAVREAELFHYDGQPLYLVTLRDGARRLLAPDGREVTTDRARLEARAPALLPAAPLARTEWLERYDDHYYSRHPERGERPLPALRVVFGDDPDTWFHIDAATGRVMERSTAVNRLYRWLYNGLHSWDIRWLWERRPLWDIAVIGFSLGGFALSLLGVIVGWRRLRFACGAPRSVLGA
jgi:hypothetical protein